MRNVFKVSLRIIVFPFVAVIIAVAGIRNMLFTMYLFLANGGEFVAHDKVYNPETHRDLFIKIKNIVEKNGDANTNA